ncbi:MAG TPA: hypothetical protein VD788_06690 [Candidatus Polarisedimenticolaceae bacterium]|nr:hypothetical protein [Candidatus Polarisedimenticolaceae bacterium]
MKKIQPGFILPSSAFTVSPRLIKGYEKLDRPPRVGDVVYGRISHVGQHGSLENRQGRIHMISDGTRAVFVYGNRYAPDGFEGVLPETSLPEVDLLARSGLIGTMRSKNTAIKDPTKVRILGHAIGEDLRPLNTIDHPIALPKSDVIDTKRRARMILNVGTSMNSGKSTTAIACCWALSSMGHAVRAAKVTGTASLKDILHMQDAGAEKIADFTHLGYPSTYLLEIGTVIEIFRSLDAKFANNPKKFWVVEFADGILQRETAALLRDEYVRSRIHRLIFSAVDAFGALGGLRALQEEFGLTPDAVSGRCTSSPLMVRELQGRTNIPVVNNVIRDMKQLSEILL